MNEKLTYRKIAVITSAIMLLLAIPSLFPYGYFQLLRWVVAGTAVYSGYLSYELDNKAWVLVMVIIALLFNPIAPIYLEKEIWVIIDVVVAVLMLVSLRFIKGKTLEEL